MRLSHISITNMACFPSLDLPLSAVVLIDGGNGQGKTLLLECIKYAFGRGHDPDLVSGDIGEIVITFDDTSMVRCRADRVKGETTRGWKPAGGKAWKMTREYIDDIAASVSYDALKFLRMSDAEQVAELLKLDPPQVGPEEFEEALGEIGMEVASDLPAVPPDTHGLEVIRLLRDALYKIRTRANTEADTHEKYAAGIREGLPADSDAKDWEAERVRLKSEEQGHVLECQRQLLAVEAKAGQDRASAKASAETQKHEIDREIDTAIAKLEADRLRRRSDVATALADALDGIRQKEEDAKEKVKSTLDPLIVAATTSLAQAEERARTQSQTEVQRRNLEASVKNAAASRARSEQLTAAMARLDNLKSTVAGRLKIPNVVIEGGRILRAHGDTMVPFARWNTAQRTQFCLRIAMMAHGKAGFILLDGAEVFSPENRERLTGTVKHYAESEGLQFLIATVGSGPLKVTDAVKGQPLLVGVE